MPPVESIKIEDFKTGRFNHETPRAITFSEAASVSGKEFVKQELANFMSDLKTAKVTRSEVQLTIDGKQEVAETLLKDVLPLSLKWTLPEPDQVDHHKLVRDVLVPSVFGIKKGSISFGSERLLFPCVRASNSGTRLCVMMPMLDILECPAVYRTICIRICVWIFICICVWNCMFRCLSMRFRIKRDQLFEQSTGETWKLKCMLGTCSDSRVQRWRISRRLRRVASGAPSS